jgi:tripartite-type tricarboxylate transporter receptor subunit TctC
VPRTSLQLLSICLASLAGTNLAVAQAWPVRPVTMIIPFAAGGALDVLGRI